ncbi:MAG: hypothetical protein KC619_19525 [Myxococcales bacterium]|nr:hypothetical protein [Myxococcales bacterium]
MGITYLDVARTRRLIPCRFLSAANAELDRERPPLDDRGFHLPRAGDTRRGPILSLSASHPSLSRNACEVDLERLALGSREPLVARLTGGLSFDEAGGVTERALPSKRRTRIRFFVPPYARATAGSPDPLFRATIGVHLGTAAGPRVGVLFVDVYEPLLVMLRPMCMLAHGPGETPTPYVFRGATPAALAELERDVCTMLAPAGVAITFYGAKSAPLHHLLVRRPAAFRAGARAHGWDPRGLQAASEMYLALREGRDIRRGGSLPLVFTPQIRALVGKGRLAAGEGLGSRRGDASGRHLFTPGIVLSDELWNRKRYTRTRIVAHEVGHLLGLLHADNQTVFGHYDDAHTRRMIMYPTHIQRGRRRHVDDVGFGRGEVGYLLTSKETPPWRYTNRAGPGGASLPPTDFVPEVRALRRGVIRGATPTAAEERRELSPAQWRSMSYGVLPAPAPRRRRRRR